MLLKVISRDIKKVVGVGGGGKNINFGRLICCGPGEGAKIF